MSQNHYIAGSCNIGQAEIARRRNVGLVGAALTFLLLAILIMSGAGRWWRLLVFFPATLSAFGFIQARLRFCIGFARIGIYNFSFIGSKNKIVDNASIAKDRKRGNRITIYALLIGSVITIVCALL